MANSSIQAACWHCTVCNMMTHNYRYNKKAEKVGNLSMFCPNCRAHTENKRKDMKKG